MSLQKDLSPSTKILVGIIVLVAVSRIPNAGGYTPWANFSAIGAMALFGGAYLNKFWKALVFPLLALLLSDVCISTIVFQGKYGVLYGGWYEIYGIFLLIVVLGRRMLKKVSAVNIIMAGLCAALLHWVLADYGVWVGGGKDLRTMQPLSRDWSGLMQCYIQGFPFFKNFLFGTWIYSAIMFGAFEWMKKYTPKLALV